MIYKLGIKHIKKKKIYFFFSLIFIYLSSNIFAEDIDIESQLLKRKEISQFDLKKKILNNKNVDFKELKTLKIEYENSVTNCFFGYQDNLRLVLCY